MLLDHGKGAEVLSLLNACRQAARWAIAATARDRTASSEQRSALVLAPHPDDETLGCGATILRKRAAGTTVVVAVVTDGRHSHTSAAIAPDRLAALRREEMAEAARRLDLPASALVWLGFEDGTLADRPEELLAAVAGLINRLRPDEVYATSALEPHPDHAAVGRAARAAAAEAGTELLEYPVWLWGAWPLAAGHRLGSVVSAARISLRRTAVVVRCGSHLAGKLHALDAHATQLRRPEGIPAEEPWDVLPPAVLSAARRGELFLPHDTGR